MSDAFGVFQFQVFCNWILLFCMLAREDLCSEDLKMIKSKTSAMPLVGLCYL